MNHRVLLIGFLSVVCLATLCVVWRQQCRLTVLRDEQQLLQARPAASADGSAAAGMPQSGDTSAATQEPALVVTPELLRLRNQVTQLTERRREFAGVRAENESLRAELAGRATNAPAGLKLPPGYVRRSEARMVGYNSPEDTIQSLLWSIQNHDMTNLLQAFAPDRADQLRQQFTQSKRSTEDFFGDAGAMPGIAVLNRKQLPDGSVELEAEMAPGLPPAPIRMRQFGSQWKITMPF